MARQRDDEALAHAEQRISQHLFDAHANELVQLEALTAHIAMTPAGEYRSGLELHLRETRDHASRIRRHLADRDQRRGLMQVGYGLTVGAIGQAMSVGMLPIDMLRGVSGEDRLLRNVRDECASEAAEIAIYLVIEQYAREVGDTETERLAASIRADEERMLERLLKQVPRLTTDAVAAEVDDNSQYDLTRTGAVDGIRTAASAAVRAVARSASRVARRTEAPTGTSASRARPPVRTPAASSSLASPTRSASTSRSPAAKRSPAKRTPAKRSPAAKRATRSRPRATAK
jgi:ferritin-like metal-binding protein YciE